MTNSAAARRLHAVPNTPTLSSRQRAITRFRRWYVALNENDAAQRTADVYCWAANRLDVWLLAHDELRDADFRDVTRDDLEEFLGDFKAGRAPFTDPTTGAPQPHKPGYVAQVYRSLCSFYKWHADKFDYASPMAKVRARKPDEPDTRAKVLTEAQVRAVLATVSGRRTDFAAVRDYALLRLLLTGLRRDELATLDVEDLDLDGGVIRVVGKGDKSGERVRYVAFNAKTAVAIDDYLALRERHRLAYERALWVGHRGTLTGRGLHSIVAKRGREAGIDGLHPHQFRHTAAHLWLADGGEEGDLMTNLGWKTREMVYRYTRETAAQRAQAEYRRRGIDNRF